MKIITGIIGILLFASVSLADLFLPKDTLIMSDRGVLVNLHIISTTAMMQKGIITGYYNKVQDQYLQYAIDTLIIQKTLTIPKGDYWHKTNDSLWQNYFYYSKTGVQYKGTFIKKDSFSLYVNNQVSLDTINTWLFFNLYAKLGIHLSNIYQSRLTKHEVKVITQKACIPLSRVPINKLFLLNGKIVKGKIGVKNVSLPVFYGNK